MTKRQGNSYAYRPGATGRWLLLLLLLLFAVHLFADFVLVPLRVESRSMQPEIEVGQRLLYSPVPVHWFGGARLTRGSLVVLTPPYLPQTKFLAQFRNAVLRFISFNAIDLNHDDRSYLNPYMVRRVVGVPGDTVKVENFIALVKKQGESYFSSEFETSDFGYRLDLDDRLKDWPLGFPASGKMAEIRLEQDEYLVLSDNRSHGSDSRHWGMVRKERILGRVVWH